MRIPPLEESPPSRANEPTSRRWAWKIGRLFGIQIYIHATFILLLAWVAYGHRAGGAGAMLRGLALIAAIFGVVVLHEIGHALVARRFGALTRDITLLPIGGVAHLERMPEKPIEELLVAASGPAVNVLLALALWAMIAVSGASMSPVGLGVVAGPFLTKLMWINVSLAVFNLLPAFPMDGGRVLRSVLALKLDRVRATEIAARLGQVMALAFGAFGVFYNPMLVLIALFVWQGAQQESATVGLKQALSGVSVASAMRTEFRVLAPLDRLSSAAEMITTGFQHDFPVADGKRLVGVLTRSDVVRGLSSAGADGLVENAMHRGAEIAHPADMLDGVLVRLRRSPTAPIIVTLGDAIVGILAAENITGFISMQGVRHAAPPRHGRAV